MRTRISRGVLVWIFLGMAVHSHAQDLLFKVGYGTYSMGNMKHMQELFQAASSAPLRVTKDFPGSFTFGLQYDYRLEEMVNIGGLLEYKRTEGQVFYSDPSGEVHLNQLLANYSAAMAMTVYAVKQEKFGLPLYINLGFSYSTLNVNQETIVRGRLLYEELDAFSTSFFLEPGLRYERQFSKLLLTLDCGYEINFAGSLYTPSNSGIKLVDSEGKAYTTDWSGLRVRLGVGFRFASIPEPYE